jgi:5-methylcytosine-specific restriction protein A
MAKHGDGLGEIIVKEYLTSIAPGQVILKEDLIAWIDNNYKGYSKSTITNWITRLTTNAPARHNWAIDNSKHDVFFKINSRELRKYNEETDPPPVLPKNVDWTDDELKAVAISYFKMLALENAGKSYNKAEENRQLRETDLPKRSKQSIEYRMANISSVLSEFCHPIINGYKPRENVGTNVKNKIITILTENQLINLDDNAVTSDEEQLDSRVANLLERGLAGKPKGQVTPNTIQSTSQTFTRDPLVKAWILENAKGLCELCGNLGPFTDKKTGYGFLEVHHVTPLANNGSDTIENATALCPNCHRKCHLSQDVEKLRLDLYSKIKR